MRDRVMQLDGLGSARGYAERVRALELLSARRGRIAADLDRQRLRLAREAARTGDRSKAVEAVRAGEAQAAAEVLERNATVQASLMRLMAVADARGDASTLGALRDQFNRLADQSEIIAPESGGRIGLSGLGAMTAAMAELAPLRVVTVGYQPPPGTAYVPPPPGTGPTVDLEAQRAAIEARRKAEAACKLDVVEDLHPQIKAEWDLAVRIGFGSYRPGDAVGTTPIRQGFAPFRFRGDCWETWSESTKRHKIFVPADSPLAKLPAAVEAAWDKIGQVAQTAANLACEVASNGVVQAAAGKLGPGAVGTVASVNAYACQRASKPAPAPAAEPVSKGAGIGILAVLAAIAAAVL